MSQSPNSIFNTVAGTIFNKILDRMDHNYKNLPENTKKLAQSILSKWHPTHPFVASESNQPGVTVYDNVILYDTKYLLSSNLLEFINLKTHKNNHDRSCLNPAIKNNGDPSKTTERVLAAFCLSVSLAFGYLKLSIVALLAALNWSKQFDEKTVCLTFGFFVSMTGFIKFIKNVPLIRPQIGNFYLLSILQFMVEVLRLDIYRTIGFLLIQLHDHPGFDPLSPLPTNISSRIRTLLLRVGDVFTSQQSLITLSRFYERHYGTSREEATSHIAKLYEHIREQKIDSDEAIQIMYAHFIAQQKSPVISDFLQANTPPEGKKNYLNDSSLTVGLKSKLKQLQDINYEEIPKSKRLSSWSPKSIVSGMLKLEFLSHCRRKKQIKQIPLMTVVTEEDTKDFSFASEPSELAKSVLTVLSRKNLSGLNSVLPKLKNHLGEAIKRLYRDANPRLLSKLQKYFKEREDNQEQRSLNLEEAMEIAQICELEDFELWYSMLIKNSPLEKDSLSKFHRFMGLRDRFPPNYEEDYLDRVQKNIENQEYDEAKILLTALRHKIYNEHRDIPTNDPQLRLEHNSLRTDLYEAEEIFSSYKKYTASHWCSLPINNFQAASELPDID